MPVLAEISSASCASSADHILDLLLDAFGFGGRQIDLVQDRHDFVVVVDRLIDVGECLRLDALACVDHQQRAFAGRQTAAHLIGEVHMARRVHQVERYSSPFFARYIEPHRLRLDGDAALALDLHGIEHLLRHFALGQAAAKLDEPVRKRRLAVIDMGDDGEIPDVREWRHAF